MQIKTSKYIFHYWQKCKQIVFNTGKNLISGIFPYNYNRNVSCPKLLGRLSNSTFRDTFYEVIKNLTKDLSVKMLLKQFNNSEKVITT